MKKFILVVILAAGAYVGYERFISTSAAYAAYKKFGKAMANEKWEEAERMVASQEVIDQISEQRRAINVLGYEAYRSFRGVLHWGPKFKLLSETYTDGESRAILKVIQEERRGVYTLDPVGPPTVRHNQTVVMAKAGTEWKVEAFDEEVHPIGPQE
ncbi:MAG TPA: hypothetical protein DCM87_01915 [Planctomycetes bacterium]|nr:hypothetical protein [Planctomycetota bacterium]